MKKALLLGLGAVAMAMGGASIVAHGFSSIKESIETKAANVPGAVGTKLYIDTNGYNWKVDGGVLGIWNITASAWIEAEHVSGNYYSITFSGAACESFDLFRGTAFDWKTGKWNQSEDAGFVSNCNLIIADGYSDDYMIFHWGTYDAGAEKSSSTIYVGHPKNYDGTFGIYTYENKTIDGVDVKFELLGDWPGKQDNPYTDGIRYNGNVVYELSLSYYSSSNVRFILSVNGDDNKSADQSLTAGSFYYATDNQYFYLGGAGHGTSSSLQMASEYLLVKDIQTAINSTEHQSVCEVEQATASSLMTRYNAIANKSIINAATIYTYTGILGTPKGDIAISRIVEELETRANSTAFTVSQLKSEGLSGTSVAVITSVVAIASVGFFLLVSRKRKEN